MKERDLNRALRAKEKHCVVAPVGDVRVVLAFPNRYRIAMSNLGFQSVYRLLCEEPRFSVDRAFIPEDGQAKIRTFERAEPLNSADLLALSISFEADYPNVLELIAQAGVDLDSRRDLGAEERPRLIRDRPLIIGGGAALTLNPEPVANFFDVIVIGEAEEVLSELSAVYFAWRESGAEAALLLKRLAELSGVYIPSLYRACYAGSGRLSSVLCEPGAPQRVVRRYVKELDRFPTCTVIQTPETEFSSMFMLETGRGCETGCRYCVSGYMYRPVRKRSLESLRATVQSALADHDADHDANRGAAFSSIGFVGAAVSSHPALVPLAELCALSGKRAAVSSIMSQRVTPQLATALAQSEFRTIALAPEAGSEELRFRVGKRVCNERIEQAVCTLAEHGIRNFKLYFMVGLPYETAADVEQIAVFSARLKEYAFTGARMQSKFSVAPKLTLSVNPFIPKPWTPFQRHEFCGLDEIKRRLETVRRQVAKIPGVQLKAESPRESFFQTLMSRGDRRVGDMLIEMRRRGLDWRGLVKARNRSLGAGLLPADSYVCRTYAADEVLPWEIIDMRVRRDLLEREYRLAADQDVGPLITRAKTLLKLQSAEKGCW